MRIHFESRLGVVIDVELLLGVGSYRILVVPLVRCAEQREESFQVDLGGPMYLGDDDAVAADTNGATRRIGRDTFGPGRIVEVYRPILI